MKQNDKVVVIGTGLVGMSYAYSLVNTGGCDELVLIDINENKVLGEYKDLVHGLSFCPNKIKIKAGVYSDCNNADIIVITAGANQKEGETRLDLLKKNAKVMKEIINSIMETNFNGVIVVATNPVDVLSNLVYLSSNYDSNKIIGSGTLLDTSRLRYELSEKLNVDPRIINAYILGEHGDSEFLCLSNAYISIKPLTQFIDEKIITLDEINEITSNVKNAAYDIIKLKNATYYAIGLALTRLTKAILDDENTIMPVSTLVTNEYDGIENVYIGVPAIIGKNGVNTILKINLSDRELKLLYKSACIIKENVDILK